MPTTCQLVLWTASRHDNLEFCALLQYKARHTCFSTKLLKKTDSTSVLSQQSTSLNEVQLYIEVVLSTISQLVNKVNGCILAQVFFLHEHKMHWVVHVHQFSFILILRAQESTFSKVYVLLSLNLDVLIVPTVSTTTYVQQKSHHTCTCRYSAKSERCTARCVHEGIKFCQREHRLD